jgi:hypothetical protein
MRKVVEALYWRMWSYVSESLNLKIRFCAVVACFEGGCRWGLEIRD